ncbi:MAG: hypothetical protein Q7R67_02265 [bacterium]|nr:hypothetical protein [bacterium]
MEPISPQPQPIDPLMPRQTFEPKRSLLKYLGVVLGMLVVAGTVYLTLRESSMPPITVEDISSWKTYRNEKCGYEIKYPPEWATMMPEGCSIGLASLERQAAYERFVENKTEGDIQISSASVYVTDWTKPLDEIELYGKRKINFLSQPAYEGFYSGLADFYVVAAIRNSKLYIIYLEGGAILHSSGPFEKTLSPFQEQILSTFKFFEPIPADWKIYNGDNVGVEFKYPSDFYLEDQKSNISAKSLPCKSVNSGGGKWTKDCLAYNLLVQNNKITGGPTESIQINGYSAEKMEMNGGLWEDGDQILVQFQKEGIWYISTITFHIENKSEADNLFNKILSTFKFTK